MPQLVLGPNRAYPSIPSVSGDLENHTIVLQAIREALEIHERRTRNVGDSFVRVNELEAAGLVTIDQSTNIIITPDDDGAFIRRDGTSPPTTGKILFGEDLDIEYGFAIDWQDNLGNPVEFLTFKDVFGGDGPGGDPIDYKFAVLESDFIVTANSYTNVDNFSLTGLNTSDQYLLVCHTNVGAGNSANLISQARFLSGGVEIDRSENVWEPFDVIEASIKGFMGRITPTGDITMQLLNNNVGLGTFVQKNSWMFALNLTELGSENYAYDEDLVGYPNHGDVGVDVWKSTTCEITFGDGVKDFLVWTTIRSGDPVDLGRAVQYSLYNAATGERLLAAGDGPQDTTETVSNVSFRLLEAPTAGTWVVQTRQLTIGTSNGVSYAAAIAIPIDAFGDSVKAVKADGILGTSHTEELELNTTLAFDTGNALVMTWFNTSNYVDGAYSLDGEGGFPGNNPWTYNRNTVNTAMTPAHDFQVNLFDRQNVWWNTTLMAETGPLSAGDTFNMKLEVRPGRAAQLYTQMGAIMFAPVTAPPDSAFIVGDPDHTTVIDGNLVEIQARTNVTGSLNAQSTLEVNGAATFDTTVDIAGAATVGDTLSVTGAATLADTLTVTGVATFDGLLNANNLATLNAGLNIAGTTTLTAGASSLTESHDEIDYDWTFVGTSEWDINGLPKIALDSEFKLDIGTRTYLEESVTGSPGGTIEVPADPFWDNLVLLIDDSDTDASTTFTDLSDGKNVITAVGTAQHDTAVTKFASSSILLDGNSDYLSVPDSADWDIAAGSFTIDCWIRFNTLGVAPFQRIASQWLDPGGDQGWTYGFDDNLNQWRFVYSTTGSDVLVIGSGSFSPVIDTWYHHRMVIDTVANTMTVYIDGVANSTGAITATIFNSSQPLLIGAVNSGGSVTQFFDGHIEDFKIYKGLALDFTDLPVPTAAAPKFPTDQDDNWEDARLIIEGGQQDNASVVFTDKSPLTAAVTANGDAQWSNAQAKFAPTSMAFDGTGDYLSLLDDSRYEIADEDFYIGMWVWFNNVSTSQDLINKYETATNQREWALRFVGASNRLDWYWSTNGQGSGFGQLNASWNPSTNTWYYVEAVRTGNTLSLYVDGSRIGTGTVSQTFFQGTAPLQIGSMNVGGQTNFFNGYMEDLRFYIRNNAGADATSTTTNVPTRTAAFATPNGDIDFANCQLLIEGGQEANGSTTFTDKGQLAQTVSVFGTAQWSDAQTKYASTSILLDGNSDYLTVPDNATLRASNTGGAITADCWFYLNSTAGQQIIMDKSGVSGTRFPNWSLDVNAGNLRGYVGTSDLTVRTLVTGTTTLAAGTWYHARLEYDGASNLRIYLDGQLEANSAAATTVSDTNPGTLNIGFVVGSTAYFNGHIEDVRVYDKVLTNGGRDFTPPPRTAFTAARTFVRTTDAPDTEVTEFILGDPTVIVQIDATTVNIGDPGFEGGSVRYNGVEFSAVMKINEFGGQQDATLILHRHDDSPGVAANMLFTRARGETAAHGNVQDNDVLGRLIFAGYHTDSYWGAADIVAVVDGTPGSGDMPTELRFEVSRDGASTPTTSLRLRSDGTVQLPTFTNATRPAAGVAGKIIFNTDDGQLNIDDGTNWTLPDGTIT